MHRADSRLSGIAPRFTGPIQFAGPLSWFHLTGFNTNLSALPSFFVVLHCSHHRVKC